MSGKFLKSNFIHRKSSPGFTLIELIIVFSLMTILSTIGIASFVNYSHAQEVQTTIQDIKTTLTTARSRALSQLMQGSCATNGLQLQGYEVLFCNVLSQSCYAPQDIANPDYELNIVCANSDGSGVTHEVVYDKKFSNTNIQYSTSKTTASSFFFSAVTGAVTTNNTTSNPSQISIQGYGITKVATSSATGVIQ